MQNASWVTSQARGGRNNRGADNQRSVIYSCNGTWIDSDQLKPSSCCRQQRSPRQTARRQQAQTGSVRSVATSRGRWLTDGCLLEWKGGAGFSWLLLDRPAAMQQLLSRLQLQVPCVWQGKVSGPGEVIEEMWPSNAAEFGLSIRMNFTNCRETFNS